MIHQRHRQTDRQTDDVQSHDRAMHYIVHRALTTASWLSNVSTARRRHAEDTAACVYGCVQGRMEESSRSFDDSKRLQADWRQQETGTSNEHPYTANVMRRRQYTCSTPPILALLWHPINNVLGILSERPLFTETVKPSTPGSIDIPALINGIPAIHFTDLQQF